jgi:hypothetical protein
VVGSGTIWGQQKEVTQDNTIMHLEWLKTFEKSVVMTVSSHLVQRPENGTRAEYMRTFMLYYRLLKTISTTISRTSSLVNSVRFIYHLSDRHIPHNIAAIAAIFASSTTIKFPPPTYSALSGEYNPLIST